MKLERPSKDKLLEISLALLPRWGRVRMMAVVMGDDEAPRRAAGGCRGGALVRRGAGSRRSPWRPPRAILHDAGEAESSGK